MKHKKKLMIIILLVFMISCDSMIIEDKKEFEAYDDELIEQIQNASNKIEIEYLFYNYFQLISIIFNG